MTVEGLRVMGSGLFTLEDVFAEADTVVIGYVTNIVRHDGLRYAEVDVRTMLKGRASTSQLRLIAYPRHSCDTAGNIGVGQRALMFLDEDTGEGHGVLHGGVGFMRFVASTHIQFAGELVAMPLPIARELLVRDSWDLAPAAQVVAHLRGLDYRTNGTVIADFASSQAGTGRFFERKNSAL